jgi:hypothetical protein
VSIGGDNTIRVENRRGLQSLHSYLQIDKAVIHLPLIRVSSTTSEVAFRSVGFVNLIKDAFYCGGNCELWRLLVIIICTI